MDFTYDEELEMVRGMAREFAEKELIPRATKHDRQEAMLSEMVRVTRPGGYVFLMEGVWKPEGSFNMFPRSIEQWVEAVEQRGTTLVRSRPLMWHFFREYLAYAPLRVSRRLIGRPRSLRGRLDEPLARLSGRLDPWLVRFIPRRLATNAALLFRKNDA